MHAGGRLLGDTLDASRDLGPARGSLGERAAQRLENHPVLLRRGLIGHRHDTGKFELAALVHEQRGVATVVKNHVGAKTIGPHQDLLGAPPVLVKILALPRVHGNALRILRGSVGTHGHSGGRVILRGENVARRPAHLGTELNEGLDKYGGLNGHVKGAGDAGTLERLALAIFLAHRHEAGHLVLGQADLVATERGEADVGDLEVGGAVGADQGHANSYQ